MRRDQQTVNGNGQRTGVKLEDYRRQGMSFMEGKDQMVLSQAI